MASKQNKTAKISHQMSLYLRFLHQEGKISCKELKCRYPNYALRSIYRHAKKKIPLNMPVDGRKSNLGRPKKMTDRDERILLRTIERLRQLHDSFTVKRLRIEAGLHHVSTRTINRCLNKNKYKYSQSRKKGLLTAKDKKKRFQFAWKFKKVPETFWRDDIAFYFDGVSFAYKRNPHNEARATKTMAWRKPNEGLSLTAKGKKEGSGGRVAHFFVAIAFSKGVVLCKQYYDTLTGETFAEFIRQYFPRTFERCGNPRRKLFLQDGDPRQVSHRAETAMHEVGCSMFAIPARSPDLNPIENIFHLARKKIHQEALDKEITKESFEEFSRRVRNTFKNFPVDIIDKTINSMNKRISKIVSTKGERTKY